MPPDHRKYAEWNPARITAWAAKTGPSTVRFVEALIKAKAVPEQAYRACLGVFRLAKSYPVARVEAACERARPGGTAGDKPDIRLIQSPARPP